MISTLERRAFIGIQSIFQNNPGPILTGLGRGRRIRAEKLQGTLSPLCLNRDAFVHFREKDCHGHPVGSRYLHTSNIDSLIPVSVDGWWEGSTKKLMDKTLLPVGSVDALLWHQMEIVILHWIEKGSGGLHQAFEVLDRMVEEAANNQNDSFKINIYLIHAVLAAWKTQFQKQNISMLPSAILKRIEGYLVKAPGLFEPNIATYTIIMDGASYCPDPSERFNFCEDLFERLLQQSKENAGIRPSEVTIGTVLKAFSKGANIQGAQKAEALLRRIIDSRQTGEWSHLEINTVHYTTVLTAYANAAAAEKAQDILLEMIRESIMGGNTKVQPNLRSFNAVLSAWSRSSSPGAYESAEQLFSRMNELYDNGILDKPQDLISYNCVLNTMAKHAFRIPGVEEKAEALVEELLDATEKNPRSSLRPTLVTFTALFRILASSGRPVGNEKVAFWLGRAKDVGISDERFLLDQYQTKLLRNEKLWIKNRT